MRWVLEMPKPTGPTNPSLRRLVRKLRTKGKRSGARLWLELAERLLRPRRARAEVNLSHINRHAQGDDVTVVIPGKVLAAGKLDRPLTIAAFKFSAPAARKIRAAGGKAITISELLEMNPRGKNVILME